MMPKLRLWYVQIPRGILSQHQTQHVEQSPVRPSDRVKVSQCGRKEQKEFGLCAE